MASLLDTIFADESLANRLAQQPVDSQTLTLVGDDLHLPDASAGLAHADEGFVATRKVVVFGHTAAASEDQSIRVDAVSGSDPTSVTATNSTPAAVVCADDAEYRLIGKLGSGGTAVVYQAHQRAIDREVAIKMLRSELATDASSRSRFLTEARVIGSLDHPNVIALHDLCVDEHGQLFYSMKRIDGTSWNQQIADRSVEDNLTILLRVADAIRYAHSRGLIHRDLKPENVMLGRFGEALVADWGLAIRVEDTRRHANATGGEAGADGNQANANERPLAMIGASTAIGGTPAYMAPEQALGDIVAIDHRTDVYLLGGILYQILTGQTPHHGRNLLECIHAAANNRIEPTDVEGELIDAALKAMATDPNDRFTSVEEFVAAIKDHRTHQESERLVRRAIRRVWPTDPASVPSDPYEQFRVGEALLHEALALWPENQRATTMLVRTQLEFARFAADQGDLDLSMRLFESAGEGESEAAMRVRRDLQRRERVRESQAKYSALFTQSPEAGLLIRWRDGAVMEANLACLSLLGYEKDELVGKTIANLSIWACPDRRKQFIAQLSRDGQVDNFETQFVRKGASADCDTAVKMAGGELVPGVMDVLISSRTVEVGGEEMLLSTIRDISQRRQAERNLEQSQRRLRDLQRLAGLGTWTYDPNMKTVSWSEEAFRLCGRDPRLGEPNLQEFLSLIHPDDRSAVIQAIERALHYGASYQLNYRQRDDQGNYRSLLSRGRPVLDTDGHTIEVYGILQVAPYNNTVPSPNHVVRTSS
ncbi:protein kinase domain-containing protein [Neorhodopirellula pilleata]|nr:protein kinase [Neorhodopirellula pilleata]